MLIFTNKRILKKWFIGLLVCSFFVSIGINSIGIPGFINKLQLGRGEFLSDKQLYDEAIQKYNKVINDPSISVIAYANRANTYYNLEDYDKALADCETIIMIEERAWFPYYMKAHIFRKSGLFSEALDNINIAVKNSNDLTSVVYSTRAMIYYNLSQYLESLNDCDKAININSSDVLAYKVRGTIFLQAGQINAVELEKAIADFNKAILLDPTDVEVYFNRALAYITQKNYKTAHDDLITALELTENLSVKKTIQDKINEISEKEST